MLAQTPSYDHCNFTATALAPSGVIERFLGLVLAMSYEDPNVRPLLDLEGLKAWKNGRTSGYRLLENAVDATRFYDTSGNIAQRDYRY